MTTKVVEVLAKILDGLNKNYSLEDVNDILNKEKIFDKQTVSAAFSLVYEKISTSKNLKDLNKKNSKSGVRIFDAEEIDEIGLEYYNYLIHLQNIGLLEYSDLEVLIEQILMFPTQKITLDDINWLVLVSLVDYDSKILPGSRVTLFSTDTIN
ncbi:MAG: DUF494 family protein [Bacteroidetes bacterium]|nr:DUF494 family protein [Bacteroidota bacterium]MBU1113635.1 DUF494 family protein [Bacteroidota bacterium]MBU1796789.1 DUF494 family protein [Bacteroidota bacterium]